VTVQIETGQVPEIEGLHPVGADQIAVILVTHAPVYPLSVLPTLTLPVKAPAGAPPPARSHGLSEAQTPRVSDHFLGTLATENDFAGIGHAPGNGENFLLRRLHLADADRPLGLQIVLQQLGRALGHVAEDLVLDLIVSTLERHDQHLAGDFA